MDVKQILAQVFTHPWLKRIPSPSLIASALAAVIHAALSAVGFELSAATTALAQIGFRIGVELLPTLITAAREGVEALTDWLIQAMAEEPEVNEAAAQTMVEQAQATAEALQEACPDDSTEVADSLGEGMAAYGGATAEIAEQYAEAMKDVTELRTLVDQMQEKLRGWANQTVEAKRGSLIENVEQIAGGKGPVEQVIRATDDSIISGVKQKAD